MPADTVLSRRGRLNALRRYRDPNDPELIAAARDLATESLAEHVQRVIDTFPPLTTDQRERITALLLPSRTRKAE